MPFPSSDSFVLWGGSISLETFPSSKRMFLWWAGKAWHAAYSCTWTSNVWCDPLPDLSLPVPLIWWPDVIFLMENILVFNSFIWKFAQVLKVLKNQFQNWAGKKTFQADLFPSLLTTVSNLHFASPDHLKISGNQSESLPFFSLNWKWKQPDTSHQSCCCWKIFSIRIFCL